jgi:kumamolisin
MTDRWTLPGSERSAPPGERVGPIDPDEPATVSVILRAGADFQANEEDVQRVVAFAAAHHLQVEERSPQRRTIRLTGTLRDLSAAFGVSLEMYRTGNVQFRGRSGPVTVSNDLQDALIAVLGLDTRPQARAHHQVAAAPAASYTPLEIATFYDFPSGANGAGQTIGIIELGGGYNASDFATYCGRLGITAPSVTVVNVDGAKSDPGADQDADTEVMLDIEVAGTIASGAKFVMYFAPNTDQGFTDAITTAVHDTANKPTVLSISWGGPESTWTQAAMTALDQACAAAAAQGITICVASGDNGSSDGVSSGNHVDFPASSPNVLGCGGTTIDGASGATITQEVAWSDSGGGVSAVFPLPAWQKNAHVPAASAPGGRGVPDVSGDADPDSGYSILVDGQQTVVGGTSAVAPLWSALVALVNQQTGSAAGLINAKLYAAGAGAFRDITSGSNGAYSAGPGWDPVTGLGRPDGAKLLSALG